MKSIKTPNHPAYHWSTPWPLEVWVRGLYKSWWFCVHNYEFCVTSIDQSLKYYSFTPSGCQIIEFRKFEFVVDKNSFVVDEKNQVL